MNAPDRIRATWYASDDDAMPKTVSALTPASRFWDTDPHLVEYIRADPARAPLAEALAVPTDDQVASACLSYRHDFGLLDAKERAALMWQAREWLNAWRKEFAHARAIGERADG